MKILYEVIGSPLSVGVSQSIVTKLVDTLVIGANASLEGLVAHSIDYAELKTLYPNLLSASTLKLYVSPAVSPVALYCLTRTAESSTLYVPNPSDMLTL